MNDPSMAGGDPENRPAAEALSGLLDRNPLEWRSDLDRRFGVLDDVLSGRRRAVIYPSARMGQEAAAGLAAMGVEVVAFGDRDTSLWGHRVDGLPVLSPEEVAADHRGDVVLVASTLFDSQICDDLRRRGCEHVVPVGYLNLRLPQVFRAREYEGAWSAATDARNRGAIEAAYDVLCDEESRRVFAGKLAYYISLDKSLLDGIRASTTIYFDPDVFELEEDEIIVDGGAFIGDTLRSFIERCSGQFHSYFAFEPDGANYVSLAAAAASDPARITAVQAGLARRTSSARLLGTHGADARLLGADEPGGESVPVVSLDEYFAGRRPPSLVKLDIEGAEAEALHGATGLLGNTPPVLAISAYHYPSDLWEIPLLMHRLMPGSRIYLRHYTREVDDSVCYAIPTGRPEPRKFRQLNCRNSAKARRIGPRASRAGAMTEADVSVITSCFADAARRREPCGRGDCRSG